jgi:uncharacterized coiled-coil protein SlyX
MYKVVMIIAASIGIALFGHGLMEADATIKKAGDRLTVQDSIIAVQNQRIATLEKNLLELTQTSGRMADNALHDQRNGAQEVTQMFRMVKILSEHEDRITYLEDNVEFQY